MLSNGQSSFEEGNLHPHLKEVHYCTDYHQIDDLALEHLAGRDVHCRWKLYAPNACSSLLQTIPSSEERLEVLLVKMRISKDSGCRET
jgi:hypothetical protein